MKIVLERPALLESMYSEVTGFLRTMLQNLFVTSTELPSKGGLEC
jgi:hypothetical protein